MFNNSSKQEKIKSDVTTVIAEDASFSGDIVMEASLHVDGTIQGKIECRGDVTIGPNGKVGSEIKARNLYVSGSVEGHVSVDETLHIHDSGKVSGDADMATIIIEENGRLNGTTKMRKKESEADVTILNQKSN
ncbi:bactofilin family protein [Salisediminibacterium beveridgei]|uniref:Protein CcmA, bactofilin family n=1 Tax=Salisediminibacterium beveridgei TaxID=632773 RepID=A0A1D7QWH1_9BACI|nr:polymer-forming cytoskeletal protein [Salisediminibacterium beveridgei]AOM83363.1 hypothetical protein BBEV_2003 [Salisediminibacterium beveridgei]